MDYVMDPRWLSGTADYSTATDPAAGVTPTMDIDYVRYYTTMPGTSNKFPESPLPLRQWMASAPSQTLSGHLVTQILP